MRYVPCDTSVFSGKIKSITPGERPMGVGPKGHRKVKRPDYKVAYVTLVSALWLEKLAP